jgi:hypothetical protein
VHAIAPAGRGHTRLESSEKLVHWVYTRCRVPTHVTKIRDVSGTAFVLQRRIGTRPFWRDRRLGLILSRVVVSRWALVWAGERRIMKLHVCPRVAVVAA